MNKTDLQIADIIQKNDKISSSEIADMVGISVSNANERVKKLQKNGIIKSWRGVLDPKKTGVDICALMLIDVDNAHEDQIIKEMKIFPEIQEIHHISGARSYMIKVRVEDTDALQAFLKLKLKPLKGITRTESFIVLETVKETTEIMLTEEGG